MAKTTGFKISDNAVANMSKLVKGLAEHITKNTEKKIFLKISQILFSPSEMKKQEWDGYYIDPRKMVDLSDLEGCEVGEEYKLVAVEMTQKEYENLPEFEGW